MKTYNQMNPAPQMQTQESSTIKDTNTCIYPSCKKQKFTESDGTIHPYCGKTHAELAHQLGIFRKFINYQLKLYYLICV